MATNKLKQRIVGALVIFALAIVFLPMLTGYSDKYATSIQGSNIPPAPDHDFKTFVIPLGEGDKVFDPEQMQLGQHNMAQKTAEQKTASNAVTKKSAGHAAEGADYELTGQAIAWVVQVGTFRQKENAQRLRNKLAQKKYTSYVEELVVKKIPIYRVMVGPELLRSNAQKLRVRLDEDTQLKTMVVRF